MWCEQFREQVPERIRQTMAEEQARLEIEDPDRVKRIRERLKDVMQLLRPRYFRRRKESKIRAAKEVTGQATGSGPSVELPVGSKETKERAATTGRGRGIGAVLSQMDEGAGEPATEVFTFLNIDAQWVSENDSENMTIVKGNSHGLRDRAAALAGADGRTASILLLNRDFRGYQAILAAVNEWANPEGDDDKAAKIKAAAEEWIEQKMIEAVQGLRQLENGSTWITQNYDEAMSPVALTAAFMADRYHTLAEVRRAVGDLRKVRRSALVSEGRSN
jgi:hypothetical protein